MHRPPDQLRSDALQIWWAGVQAVQPSALVFQHVHVDGSVLHIADEAIDLNHVDRIAVVGAGKAAGGIALALEQAIGPQLRHDKQLWGHVNVPDGSDRPTDSIVTQEVRPVGVNEPTDDAVGCSRLMLQIVDRMGPRDLCLCLISGGASAMLAIPRDGFSLEDKVALTRELSARGANIYDLNIVRRELSSIKGGRLARACKAGRLVSLILSDVPGDDLGIVGSGPTVETASDAKPALHVLRELRLDQLPAGRRAIEVLMNSPPRVFARANPECRVLNVLLANNAAAVDAAGVEAERLGYSHAMLSATEPEGRAEDVACQLAAMADRMRSEPGPDCLITGGEPTVQLAPADQRGRGGRNQQLALAALAALDDWQGLALLSGGTDGEDGPTDAAGALVDEQIAEEANRQGLDAAWYLARNDAYAFFEQSGGLLKTGPTHTNVCDLRVVTVSRST